MVQSRVECPTTFVLCAVSRREDNNGMFSMLEFKELSTQYTHAILQYIHCISIKAKR